MRSLIAIRTHRWAEDEECLLSRLRQVAGHDLAVVFHNRPEHLALPIDTIDIRDGWLAQNGFRVLRDWGWRCGDYFYYRLREARPGYDFYWLIEPDVFFTSDPGDFFAAFADATADAMGFRLGPFAERNAFARGLPGLPHHQAIFALTRLSGRAIDRLAPLRRAYGRTAVAPRFYTNDELFVFSHVAADAELSSGRLEEIAPAWFEGARVAPSPDMLRGIIAASAPPGRVFHPVRGRESFKNATASRLAGQHAFFLSKIRDALAGMDDAELDQIAAAASADILSQLKAWRHSGRRRQQGG